MVDISDTKWAELDASNNSPSPDGWASSTMLPTQVEPTGRAMMGAIKRFWDRIQGVNASTGSANAYVLTPTAALGAYVTGERYSFRSNFANTGAATLNISGLGAKTIKKMTASGKADLASGDIQSGQPVTVEYDGTDLIVTTALAVITNALLAQMPANTIKGNNTAGTANAADIAGGQFPATKTNDDAAAGLQGELMSAAIASGSAVSLTSTTAANVVSLALTPGDWDVSGMAYCGGGATTTVQYVQGSISTTSGVIDGNSGRFFSNFHNGATIFGTVSVIGSAVAPTRISISTNTTVYLVVVASFGVSTLNAYGSIRARRVR